MVAVLLIAAVDWATSKGEERHDIISCTYQYIKKTKQWNSADTSVRRLFATINSGLCSGYGKRMPMH